MKYIFCSFMFDDVEENIKNSKNPNSVSGHLIQENMVKGLTENGCDICLLNTPRIRRYPDYKKIVVKKTLFKSDYVSNGLSIGFLNIFLFNYLTQIFNLTKELKRIVVKNPQEKIILLVYNTYLAQILAMRRIKKRYPNVIICNVIGDIYGKYGLKTASNIHGKILETVHTKMDKMASECDAFALATENMIDALKINNKPYTIMEGMYNVSNIIKKKNFDNKKIVFYAGALLDEYGIGHMLRAFSLIKDSSFVFLIAGNGDALEDVLKISETDKRIKYLGFITPKEVLYYQTMATVLVNPRTSENEYVKYSFASKNLECLASGIPYIAHKLPCNPEEYSDVILYPDNESDIALAKKIEEICNLSYFERKQIGRKGQDFIMQYKSPKEQMKKVHDMLQNL